MRELTFDVEQRIARRAEALLSRHLKKTGCNSSASQAVCPDPCEEVRGLPAPPPPSGPLVWSYEHNNALALAVACALNSNVDLQCEDEPYALQYFYITL